MRRQIGICILFVFSFFALSATNSRDGLSFVENKGQWNDCVRFKSEFRGGALFLEESAVTFLMQHPEDMEAFRARKFAPESAELPEPVVRMYAWRVHFLNARPHRLLGEGLFPDYHNYYLGKDPQHWASEVRLYERVCYQQLYEGIDLYYTSVKSSYKYEFHLQPQADPAQIAMLYEGADKLYLKEGNLYIRMADYEMVELKPYAYQEDDYGNRSEVACRFVVKGERVTFRLGRYDTAKALVIDPVMVFCSYTGSKADNWGYTATYDRHGNLYGGGVAFGTGYPTTLGAFQTKYALGGSCDIAITKFSSDGTTILFSTYLGGNGSEVPHSLVVNDNDELFVLASTSSDDFPVLPQAFDTTFSFTDSTFFVLTNTIYYINGSDIAVAKFNATGTQLMGSTYFGGSGYDGLSTDVGLRKNYADEVRGEIMVDAYSNVYVVSSTNSQDLPVSATAFQPQYGGGKQDGCIAKFSYDLRHLIWSSYMGGDSSDALYSMVLDKNDNLYVCGGTKSRNLPTTSSVVQGSHGGGVSDGFIAHVSTNGNQLKALTYYGKEGYDQTYLIKKDQADNVYVMGLTDATGFAWISNAQWYVSGGGQFISKLNPLLTKVVWSTAFGTTLRTGPDLSPTALMVDLCGHVYFSGWGSPDVNAHVGNKNCGTRGLPLSTDALKLTTDNNDFYFFTLDKDASNMLFGSFFGGFSSGDHVDGGTSRFDRKGCIYQAICASCGGVNDLPVTDSAAARYNRSFNCNLGVVKIDFNIQEVVADFSMPNVVCAPYQIAFDNTSRVVTDTTTSFYWDFGDGTSSTQKNPTHDYVKSGTYTVRLVVYDTSSCNVSDTLCKDLLVLSNSMDTLPDRTICKGDFIQIGIPPASSSNVTYSWYPADGLSGTEISNPIASDTVDRTYYMTITDGNCVDTLRVRVHVVELKIGQLPGLMRVCQGDSLHVYPHPEGPATFQWSSGPYFRDTLNASLRSPELHLANGHTATYYLRMRNDFCVLTDSLKVKASVLRIRPADENTACFGDTVCLMPRLSYTLGDTLVYQWQNSLPICSSTPVSQLCVKAEHSSTVFLQVTNQVGCMANDTFRLTVDTVEAHCFVSEIQCPGMQNGRISVQPFNGMAPFGFQWIPDVSQDSVADHLSAGDYEVLVTDTLGCTSRYLLHITEPQPLQILIADSNLQTYCKAACAAFVQLQVQGGEPPYDCVWNTGDTGFLLQSMCAGQYRFYLEDARHCRDTFSVEVRDTSDFYVTVRVRDATCPDKCDGSIAMAPHGVPPYTLQWSTGQTSVYAQDLCAGQYDIWVEDARQCHRRIFPEVKNPPPIVIDSIRARGPVCSGESNGWIELFVSGRDKPEDYHFFWNGVEGGSLHENLVSGSYHLHVADSIGCGTDTLIVLREFDSITCEITATKVPCEEICNAVATSVVQGGSLPYRYFWDNGDTNSNTENLCKGSHSLVVTDANGCTRTFVFGVTDSSSFSQPIHAWAEPYEIYAGEKSLLYATDLGTGFHYQWSPTEGLTPSTGSCVEASPDDTLVYEVIVTDTFGCMRSDTVLLIVTHVICDNPYVYVPNSFSPNGDGLNDVLYVRGDLVERLHFAVYDRWGECVFETTDQRRGWDGTYKGKECVQGVYVYYLEVHCKGRTENLLKGNVTLIR